jgi:Flavodoxin
MTALIVVESSFGNTRDIAEAIHDGLAQHVDVDLVDVADAPAQIPDSVDLLVVGGPTQAFGMSRSQTREDAVSRGAHPTTTKVGIREWITSLTADGHHPPVVTFDTRTKHRWVPGSAAAQAAAALADHDFPSAAPRESFRVEDIQGPLLPGEVDRAREWGHRLGTEVVDRLRLHPR